LSVSACVSVDLTSNSNRFNVVALDNYHSNVPLMGTNSFSAANLAGVSENEIGLVVDGDEAAEKGALVVFGAAVAIWLHGDSERLRNEPVELSLDRRHYFGWGNE
jgi:hypothetical protein